MIRIAIAASMVLTVALSMESYGQHGFSRPLESLQVNQGFGWRLHPLTGLPDFHNGTDLKADFQPVFSIAAGRVLRVGANAISGNFIIIRHGKLQSHYAHLSRVLISNQDSVFQGQLLGLSGNSGRTTGPHLHFALSYCGIKIDAMAFLKALCPPDSPAFPVPSSVKTNLQYKKIK